MKASDSILTSNIANLSLLYVIQTSKTFIRRYVNASKMKKQYFKSSLEEYVGVCDINISLFQNKIAI